MPKIKLVVYPRYMIDAILNEIKRRVNENEDIPENKVSIISFIDFGDDPSFNSFHNNHPLDITGTILFKDLLTIRVNDLDEQIEDYKIFDTDMAKQVVDFVKKNIDAGIKTFYVHCAAGVSRSAGCAAAISKYYNGTDEEFFNSNRHVPNRLIYRLILEEFHNQEN